MRDFFLKIKDYMEQFQQILEDLKSSQPINVVYDAGLTDVIGPKPMTLIFKRDRLQITYRDFVKIRKIIIRPEDILELELGIQAVDKTANAITGAITGNIVAGPLGALAMASHNSKRSKEDFLHLIIKYKDENRPLIFQSTNKTQKIYALLKKLSSKAKRETQWT